MIIACTLAMIAGLVVGVESDSLAQPDPPKRSVPAAADDVSIKAIVAYFAKNGIKLQHDKGGRWVVVDPKGEGYEVDVYLRTFSAGVSEKEMWDDLRRINLGFLLNVPVRVAMSVPGLVSTDPAKPLPKLDQVPSAAKLERLFKEYRPTEAKK